MFRCPKIEFVITGNHFAQDVYLFLDAIIKILCVLGLGHLNPTTDMVCDTMNIRRYNLYSCNSKDRHYKSNSSNANVPLPVRYCTPSE